MGSPLFSASILNMYSLPKSLMGCDLRNLSIAWSLITHSALITNYTTTGNINGNSLFFQERLSPPKSFFQNWNKNLDKTRSINGASYCNKIFCIKLYNKLNWIINLIVDNSCKLTFLCTCLKSVQNEKEKVTNIIYFESP